jgi:gas vesicle protein
MTKDCLIGFAVGVGVGTGLGLLLAPRSGARTQALIARKVRKSKSYFQAQVSGLRSSANDLLDKGKEQVSRHREGLEKAFDAGRHAYKNVMA